MTVMTATTATTARPPHPNALVLLLAVAVTAPTVQADEFETADRDEMVCELEDLTRRISLRRDPEAGYVCDVLYEKPDEQGTSEVLWSARNDPNYCTPHFSGLIEQLRSNGWDCSPVEDTIETAEARSDEGGGEASAPADGDGSAGARDRLYERCLATMSEGGDAEGSATPESRCDCMSDEMDRYAMSEEEARSIDEALAASSETGAGEGGSAPRRDKRLNTLMVTYEEIVASCRG